MHASVLCVRFLFLERVSYREEGVESLGLGIKCVCVSGGAAAEI